MATQKAPEQNGIMEIAAKLITGDFYGMTPEELEAYSITLHKFHLAYTKIVRPDWDKMVEQYLIQNGSDSLDNVEVKPLRKPRSDKKAPAKKAVDLSGLDI